MKQKHIRISKFLSLILRHNPGAVGLSLDPNGWVSVDELLSALAGSGRKIDRALLEQIVATNNKKRFAFSEDGTLIRANQGHSLGVDLQLEALPPPKRLFHGTATRFLKGIWREGLLPKSRQHVHLSEDFATASDEGRRHGRPVILEVNSEEMAKDRFSFFRSANGVWLTEHVPPEYLAEMAR